MSPEVSSRYLTSVAAKSAKSTKSEILIEFFSIHPNRILPTVSHLKSEESCF